MRKRFVLDLIVELELIQPNGCLSVHKWIFAFYYLAFGRGDIQ